MMLAPAVFAQANKTPAGARKLYCWNEGGQRVCSDALPPGKENLARDEISARSGLRTGQAQRALSEEERALAASEEVQRQADEAVLGARRRTDQAMLASYQTEELRARVRRAHQHRREQHPHLALQRGQPARGTGQPAALRRPGAAGWFQSPRAG